jgi:hypothetical protein
LIATSESIPSPETHPGVVSGAKFKRNAAEWRKLARGVIELPFAETKRQMVRPLFPHGWVASLLIIFGTILASGHRPAFLYRGKFACSGTG